MGGCKNLNVVGIEGAGRGGVTPGSALRLAKFFGNTPDFWMNLQLR